MNRALIVSGAFLVGACLCVCGVEVFTEAEFPLLLFASPTILVATWVDGEAGIIVGGWMLLLAPFYWALLAWIATARFNARGWVLAGLLFVQYAATAIMAWQVGRAELFALSKHNPLSITVCLGVYCAIHVPLWRSILAAAMEPAPLKET